MAANDLNAWLASLMPNAGAGQPYGPGGAPAYGTSPAGFMPGGGAMGYGAQTPGQPSMGYPAMGQPGPQAAPAPAAPGQGQPFLQFGGFHPGNILQSHPPGSASLGPVFNASGSPGGPGPGPGGPASAGNDGGFNNPFQAAAGATAPQAPGPMDPSIIARQSAMQPNYPSWPTPGPGGSSGTAATVANAPPGNPSDTPRPAKGPLATSGGGGATMKRTPGAPNLGYYQGNPRFSTIQYRTPNSSASRAPIYTALNLGGGGQQPAVNPNVPAANAQPVSASAPNAYPGDAGWDIDAQGNVVPSYGDPATGGKKLAPGVARARILNPNYYG